MPDDGVREPGGRADATVTYGYDQWGRRAYRTLGNGTTTTYGYDGASRLTALNLIGGTQPNAVTLGYTPAGQIASRTASNDAYAWGGAVNVERAYAVNRLNQYTASGSVTPTYDLRGNLSAAGTASYGYDAFDQLTSANVNGVPASLTYDTNGLVAATGTTRWEWDGGRLVTYPPPLRSGPVGLREAGRRDRLRARPPLRIRPGMTGPDRGDSIRDSLSL